jgi:uncharacterized Tic20 family protein
VSEERNYGIEPDPKKAVGPGPGSGMSPSDEKTWSVLAHLSIFLNLFTGFLGPVAAFIIWIVYKDRSPRVGFHALQSLWYQGAWILVLAVGWTISTALTVILIGFLLIPLMLILTVVPFVHAGYAAYKVNQSVDYRYLWVADMVEGNRQLPR